MISICPFCDTTFHEEHTVETCRDTLVKKNTQLKRALVSVKCKQMELEDTLWLNRQNIDELGEQWLKLEDYSRPGHWSEK